MDDPMIEEAAAGRLGPDLSALVEDVGVPLIAAALVTTIASSRVDRACFRLTFADGTVLKGRRVESVGDAERLAVLTALLDARHFPRVIARRGRALLTPWIQGRAFAAGRDATALMRRCGALHRGIHRRRIDADVKPLRRRSTDWEPRLEKLLDELVMASAIDAGFARAVHHLASHHAPQAARSGLCHGDFCGENMVQDQAGDIQVVDNDSLAVDEYEYDLARTWYRWPLSPAALRAYVDGYGRSEHGIRFAEHFLHWALTVVIESSAFRVRARSPLAHEALARLRALLKTEGRFETFPRLLAGG
jgi:thiamine kinase-like enzyme